MQYARVTERGVTGQDEALRVLATITRSRFVHPVVRTAALAIRRDCASRDDECELQAIYDAVKSGTDKVLGLENGIPYVADPNTSNVIGGRARATLDFFTSPDRLLLLCRDGSCGEDCLPHDTLVLGAGYAPRPIGEVEVGDVIMGDGGWTHVTGVYDKGVQRLLEFDLSNGGVLRCTSDHRVFRVPKGREGRAGQRADAEEVRAGDLAPGDDLLTVERLPFGNESMDAEKAWLLGVHVADGWVNYDRTREGGIATRRVAISGKDGERKQAQKERVKAYCEARGLPYRWHDKYIMINDRDTSEWLAACGRGAINKRLPSLNWDEPTVQSIISGLAADACVADGTFGTISPTLALQLRLLHRMLGVSTHIRRVDNHGGLGRNAIYRVAPRHGHADGREVRKFARVKSISEGGEEPTVDIEVDGHRFYLPETDLVVHNCDGHGSLVCALAGTIGFLVGLRTWGRGPVPQHVYAVAGLPKGRHDRVVGLDTTVDGAYVGWEPPGGRVFRTAWL